MSVDLEGLAENVRKALAEAGHPELKVQVNVEHDRGDQVRIGSSTWTTGTLAATWKALVLVVVPALDDEIRCWPCFKAGRQWDQCQADGHDWRVEPWPTREELAR